MSNTVDLALSIGITAVIAIVAVSVAVVPIMVMLVSEHRNLHGDARSWRRAHRRGARSLMDIPRQYNQTSEEQHQERV